jgi:hypothetical protein
MAPCARQMREGQRAARRDDTGLRREDAGAHASLRDVVASRAVPKHYRAKWLGTILFRVRFGSALRPRVAFTFSVMVMGARGLIDFGLLLKSSAEYWSSSRGRYT